jgi:epoxyqueuosine reductase
VRSLKEQIKSEARRLGFSLVGVTSPKPPSHFQTFESWIASEFHGEMHYLATERSLKRRSDPLEILPDCRSILVLGFPHFPPETGNPVETTGRGLTAAYAWGQDYHHILKAPLKALVEFIEKQVGQPVPNRWYTDTGPILERDLAQAAGLGWIGKNTCLINPERGSFFLLAEILLGLPLEPDAPFAADHCGTCTRCLDACPTGCIHQDRTIDSRRCISYLTIELKGFIPPDLRPQMGSWIFGCDICQQVCPWNIRFAPPDGHPDLAPGEGIPSPVLLDQLALSPEAFNRKFKSSPFKRSKRRGYLRNVTVALGNQGDPSSVSSLAACLRHEHEPLVRGHAAWGLGRIGSASAREALLRASSQEKDPDVRREIDNALRMIAAVT